MILNAYYRLRFYENTLLRTVAGSQLNTIATPSTTMCDGTTYAALCAGENGTEYPGTWSAYRVPYNGMRSQTVAVSYGAFNYANILVGTGTTAPAADDYRLENELVDELDCLSVTYEYTADGALRYYKTMVNVTDETITVTEVGLTEPWSVSASGTAAQKQVLVMREVPEKPIVVEPGESFTVKVEHAFQVAA